MRGPRGLASWFLTTSAILLSLTLPLVALTVPVYGGAVPGEATLVDVNGPTVLIPVCIPLVLAVIAWVGLRRKCVSGSRSGERSAFWALVLLFAYGFITGFSIGAAVTAIAALVALGFMAAPQGREPHDI